MLSSAACGKQDRGKQDGASIPESERGFGLGDRSHGGEIAERRHLDPVKENYKPIATGRCAVRTSQEREVMSQKRDRQSRSGQPEWSLNLEVVHPNAAGIDIGNQSHYVAIAPNRDPNPVRQFACFTEDLHRFGRLAENFSD